LYTQDANKEAFARVRNIPRSMS